MTYLGIMEGWVMTYPGTDDHVRCFDEAMIP